ncbi:hypothetical protein [Sulfitobacter delicatus]|uniref:Beta-barrel assembly machine subunit BamF n=1 Tax=Sulfitobacter delicatus TaxID=218672 RepID=A0A1G7KGP8_9RHOB|nr:hypothetical protein [Sulfitobacter delicatus]SDF36372.1 hypothetical protein SAMN04489759_10219 [Sulfitobacter delicatus]
MKPTLFVGALSLTLGACATTLPPLPDVTAAYVQQPTPLPEVAAMTAADNRARSSAATAEEQPFAGYRRRGVVEPLDWRRLNAEQAPMQGMNH